MSWLPPHLSMVLSILPHCLMFTSGRPRLAALHVATLVYGVIIEIFGFWCPLTALEDWLQVRGGVSVYRGPFPFSFNCQPRRLVNYLRRKAEEKSEDFSM